MVFILISSLFIADTLHFYGPFDSEGKSGFSSIATDGYHLFVGTFDNGIEVYQTETGKAPIFKKRIPTPEKVRTLNISGGTLIIGASSGIYFYDIRNLDDIHAISMSYLSSKNQGTRPFYVNGDRLFITGIGNNAYFGKIPDTPGKKFVPSSKISLDGLAGGIMVDDYIYVCRSNVGSYGYHIKENFELEPFEDYLVYNLGSGSFLDAHDTIMLYAPRDLNELILFDTSNDPTRPRIVSTINHPKVKRALFKWPYVVTLSEVQDNSTFGELFLALKLMDYTTPELPRERDSVNFSLKSVSKSNLNQDMCMVEKNGLVWIALGKHGIQQYSLKGQTLQFDGKIEVPVLLPHASFVHDRTLVQINDQTAFSMTATESGIQTNDPLDLSSVIAPGEEVSGATSNGSQVYLATWDEEQENSSLKTFGIYTPDDWSEIFTTSDRIQDVYIHDNLLCLWQNEVGGTYGKWNIYSLSQEPELVYEDSWKTRISSRNIWSWKNFLVSLSDNTLSYRDLTDTASIISSQVNVEADFGIEVVGDLLWAYSQGDLIGYDLVEKEVTTRVGELPSLFSVTNMSGDLVVLGTSRYGNENMLIQDTYQHPLVSACNAVSSDSMWSFMPTMENIVVKSTDHFGMRWGNGQVGTLIPHLSSSFGGFTTTVSLFNEKSQDIDFNVWPFKKDGSRGAPARISIAANSTKQFNPAEVFPGIDASHLIIDRGQDLEISTNFTNGNSVGADTFFTGASSKVFRLESGPWNDVWDGIAVVNSSMTELIFHVSQVDKNRKTIDSYVHPKPLKPGGKLLLVLNQYFKDDPDSHFFVNFGPYSVPYYLVALRGTHDQDLVYQVEPEPYGMMLGEQWIPHVTEALSIFETRVTFSSIQSTQTIELEPYTKDGTLLSKIAVNLQANTRKTILPHDYDQRISHIKVPPNDGKYSVRYSYALKEGRSVPADMMPKRPLHSCKAMASNHPDSWDGFAIVNPGETDAHVAFNIVSADRTLLSQIDLTLSPGQKELILPAKLGGQYYELTATEEIVVVSLRGALLKGEGQALFENMIIPSGESKLK